MSTARPPFKVLVIDDSALMRKVVSAILSQDPALTIVGTARDPFDAREKIKILQPDVLTLDIEMPRMDGLSFLENLMRLRPLPVVMVSSLTERGADATLAALELGAVDFVSKASLDVTSGSGDGAHDLIEKVKNAASTNVEKPRLSPLATRPGTRVKPELAARSSERLIALGASTGGTEALSVVLESFTPEAPPTLIAQHIPEIFSARFADRLNERLPLTVREARDGDALLTGHVYVAPGGFHLRVARRAGQHVCEVTADAPINRHRPSVDALFFSVAKAFGANALGALLTGMGADGADGLLAMSQAGARTLAQDQATCVVWGMPREAVRRGAAREVLPLDEIGSRIMDWAADTRDQRRNED